MLGVEENRKSRQIIETSDFVKLFVGAYNPALVTATFGPASGYLYYKPFKVCGLHRVNIPTFKFSWTPSGFFYSFDFRLGLYKLSRGKGGTSSTWRLVREFGSITRTAPAAGATEYALSATSVTANWTIGDGVYCIAFKWYDSSAPGSSVSFSAYGTTLASYADWYFGSGSSVGSGALPSTIATVGTLTGFQIYFMAI